MRKAIINPKKEKKNEIEIPTLTKNTINNDVQLQIEVRMIKKIQFI